MNKIYTKKGDKGTTGTFLGRMSKADNLAEALGAIDELNSWIGMVRVSPSPFGYPPLKLRGGTKGGDIFKNIQTNLMVINSILAGSTKFKFNNKETKKLEKIIDKLTKDLPELKNFIYPVGNLQLARAVCRRAERKVVKLEQESGRTGEYKNILQYLNRLSDALFMMARHHNRQLGIKEEIWK